MAAMPVPFRLLRHISLECSFGLRCTLQTLCSFFRTKAAQLEIIRRKQHLVYEELRGACGKAMATEGGRSHRFLAFAAVCVCVGGWVQETGKDLNRITKRVLPVFEEASLSAVACSILEPCVFDFQ